MERFWRLWRFGCGAALLLGLLIVAGCAQQPSHAVDPIFTAVPGGRYYCDNVGDDRNPVVKGATSSVGQAAAGGALGGLIGNQFGAGRGQTIATGLGAAAGVAAGAWNGRRMADNRRQACRQRNARAGRSRRAG